MAANGGVAKRTYCNYESGEREPSATFLELLGAAGADVQYILTGVRAGGLTQTQTQGEALTPREAALLDNYRHSAPHAQDALDRTCAALAQPCKRVDSG